MTPGTRIILDNVKSKDQDRALSLARNALADSEMGVGQHFGYRLWRSEVPHVTFFVWRNKRGVTVRATYTETDTRPPPLI